MPRAPISLPSVDPAAPAGRCRLQGCATPANVRGLCLPHYDLARRHGRREELALPAIPRGRRLGSAPESAPSPRPQRAPRTRRASPPPPETEALQAIWAALGSPSGLSPSEPLALLRAAEERLRLDASCASRITGLEEAVRLRARVEELEIVQAAATTARVRLAEILQEPTSTPWRQLLDQVEDLEGEAAGAQRGREKVYLERADLIQSLLDALGTPDPGPDWRPEELVEQVRGQREQLQTERARVLALAGELRGQVDRLIGQDALWLILAPGPEESLAAAALRQRLRLAEVEGEVRALRGAR